MRCFAGAAFSLSDIIVVVLGVFLLLKMWHWSEGSLFAPKWMNFWKISERPFQEYLVVGDHHIQMMRNCVNHWILNRDSPNMLCIKNTFPPKLDMWICTAHFTRANFGSKTTFDRIFASKLEKYYESIKIVKATKLNFTKTNYVNELQQSLCIHYAASIFPKAVWIKFIQTFTTCGQQISCISV